MLLTRIIKTGLHNLYPQTHKVFRKLGKKLNFREQKIRLTNTEPRFSRAGRDFTLKFL